MNDPADDLLAASQSPWIKIGGGLALLAGLVGLGVGLQGALLLSNGAPAYLPAIALCLVFSAVVCLPAGFGVLQKSERLCTVAVGSTGLLALLSLIWSVLMFANGVFSLMSIALAPMSLLALLGCVLALPSVRRAAKAMAALSA
jgi:hypothetical protein